MSTIGHWVNGERSDSVPIQSRALNYGDGVFETIRVRKGNAEFFGRHMARLKEGCKRLRINPVNWNELKKECELLLLEHENVVLKVLLARGSGQRGYQFDVTTTTDRFISLFSLEQSISDESKNGVRLRLCETRLAAQPLLAGIKHLNRLEQILARAEWSDPAIREGVMCNANGQVIEGTMSNLFIIRGEKLYTPELSQCGVSGVLRSVVLDVAKKLNIETRIEAIEIDDLAAADELFICNSLMGICPVSEILELRCYQVREVGEMTKRIQSSIDYAESEIDTWYPV